jgi:hypothetical protein
MTQSGIAYKLPTLAHRISGTGYGSSPTHSIPTPTAQDHIERRSTSTEVLNPETNKSVSLDRFVKFWPTPNTVGYRSDGELKMLADMVTDPKEYRAMSSRAAESKRQRYWPTPRSCSAMAATVNPNATFPNLETVVAQT